jgi:glycosyltransferase involved in cell wall biosynthesis
MCGVIPVPPLTREHWEAAQATARACPNLEVRGFLDHDRLAELFQGASLFVHTSPAEGFPNTLLEAWSYGVPSVTSVDPDGVITRGGMGEVATEFPRMLEAVRRMLADPELRRAAGARARAYVESHHGPERVYGQLAGVLDPLVAAGRARRSRG